MCKKVFIALCFSVLCLTCYETESFAALGAVINSWSAPAIGSRGLAWDGSFLWYSSMFSDTVYKLNPSDGSTITSFAAANINSADMEFVGGELWNIDLFPRTFYSVNPGAGPPWSAEFSKPANDFMGLTYDGANLWASDFNFDLIVKMDLSGNAVSSYPAPSTGSSGMAWDGTYLWMSDTNTDLIYKIDPSSGATVSTFSAPSGNSTGLTFDGQYLWSTDIGTNMVYQIDAGYAAPVGPTPAPASIVSSLSMLIAFCGWFSLVRRRDRIRKANSFA